MTTEKLAVAAMLLRQRRFASLFGLASRYLTGRNLYLRYLDRTAPDGLIERRIHDVSLYLDPADSGISRTLLMYGSHEPVATELFRRELSALDGAVADPIAIDIGANKGYYAFQERRLLSSGTVYAVEPDETNLRALRLGCEANGFDGFVIDPCAIGENDGVQTFYRSERSNRHTLVPPPSARSHLYEDETTTVPVKRFQTFVDDHDVRPEEINVIRMDLEGAETVVFDGLDPVLEADARKVIFVELHPHRAGQSETRSIISRLEETGFEICGARTSGEEVVTTYDALRRHCATDDPSGAAELIARNR